MASSSLSYTNDVWKLRRAGDTYFHFDEVVLSIGGEPPQDGVGLFLDDEGEIEYRVVRVLSSCDTSTQDKIEIPIVTESGSYILPLHPIQPIAGNNYPSAFSYFILHGIPIVRMRSFQKASLNEDEIQSFRSSASELTSHDAAILDLRGNHGGDSSLGREWLIELVGQYTSKGVVAEMDHGQFRLVHYSNRFSSERSLGVWLFVLVDSGTASAAEMLVSDLSGFPNVCVLGTNTAGAFAYGDTVSRKISDPPLSLTFGTKLFFLPEFVETRGILPDIWYDGTGGYLPVVRLIQSLM